VKLPVTRTDGGVRLRLFDEVDLPWIGAVIDTAEGALGRPWRELLERWRATPPRAAAARGAIVVHALRRMLSGRVAGGLRARAVRERVLGAVANDDAARAERVRLVAEKLGVDVEAIEAGLWADLASERLVTMPTGRPTEAAVCAAANLTVLQAALGRAYDATVRLTGNPRPVMRLAALGGLIHAARATPDGVVVDVSGPLALFERTTVYGQALGRLVPALAWCEAWSVRARCRLGGEDVEVVTASPVILPPARPPRRFDSALEARLARDLARLAPAWHVEREPEVVVAGPHLLFPDFALTHRDDATRRWWIEIVGFWTTDHLAQKLARYRVAGLANLILCIPGGRSVSAGDVPSGAQIVRFDRAIPSDAVLRLLR